MVLKSLQFNRILAALFLAAVVTVGSMLPLFAAGQAQASIGYSVFGWGENSHFQLATGQGATDQTHPLGTQYLPTGLPNLTAVHNTGLPTGRGIERLYSGLQHNIAIMADGSVFAWGRGDSGQTGHGRTPTNNLPRPTEIPILTGLNRTVGIEVIHTGQFHNIAILEDGRVFVWGLNNRGQLGLGHTDEVDVPRLNPILTEISQNRGIVKFRNGSHTNHILTGDGHVYGWGQARYGQLGLAYAVYAQLDYILLGTPPEPHRFLETPTEIPYLTNLHVQHTIVEWHSAGHHNNVIMGNGSVWAWGRNAASRTGIPGGGAIIYTPTQAPALTNINNDPNRGIDRLYLGYDMSMLVTRPNAAGQVTAYLWGTNSWGAIGNGTPPSLGTPGGTVSGPTPIPAVSAIFNNYDTVVRAHKNQHTANWLFIAYRETTSTYTAYGWGAANFGRTGLDGGDAGGSGHVLLSYPVEIPQVSELANMGAQFFLGGRFTFAFDPVEPPGVGLRKTLQMAEGASPPDSVTFRFQFTPRGSVELNPGVYSRPLPIPPVLPNATPPGSASVTLHGADAFTANTVTVVGNFNLMDAFGLMVFSSGGVYVWEVEEIRTGPHNSGTTFPSFMDYDTSRFQVRVHANSAGVATAIEVFRMNYANGTWTVGDKVPRLDFLNTYRKLAGPNTPHNGLEIRKRVDGIHANLSTPFTFTLNLTEHFLAPLSFPITAHILAADGVTQTPHNILGPSQTVNLRHNERFIVPAIYAGTTFTVTETGVANFTPSYRITTGNVQDTAYTVGTVGNNLTTRNYNNIVWDTGRNAADFTNIHSHTPPVGLFIASAPWIVAVVFAVLAVALMVTARNRKRIEELPLVI